MRWMLCFGGLLLAIGCMTRPLYANPLEGKPTIRIWELGAPGAVGTELADVPLLSVYTPTVANTTKAAVIVVPGGGYGGLANDHEGHQIGVWLNSQGLKAYVLTYRLAPRYRYPAALQDAQRAIQWVRANAASENVDPSKLGMIGFSAGGHLASSAATTILAGLPDATDPIERVSSRPDFVLLCYPVITLEDPYTHGGSRSNLLGPDATPARLKELSTHERVTSDTPPMFLFHTGEDTPVPAENSVLMYMALRKAGVPAELHVFERGVHGVGLAVHMRGTEDWPELAAKWMLNNRWMDPDFAVP
jgi:acetyl esterase/lipase